MIHQFRPRSRTRVLRICPSIPLLPECCSLCLYLVLSFVPLQQLLVQVIQVQQNLHFLVGTESHLAKALVKPDTGAGAAIFPLNHCALKWEGTCKQ